MGIVESPAAARVRPGWLGRRRAEWVLSLQITLAALLTFAVGSTLGLHQIYWGVLSTVMVLQSSVGGSFKATLDRLVGTMAGAFWGVSVSLIMEHAGVHREGVALTLVVAPLAVLAGFFPNYRIAPVTGIIVLLSSLNQPGSVVSVAENRVIAIALGCLVALVVALMVLPARAHELLRLAVQTTLDRMGQHIRTLRDATLVGIDSETVNSGEVTIREAMARVEAATIETRRERHHRLSDAPDPDPLARSLRRLQHDLVIIGRATAEPLPGLVHPLLASPVTDLFDAIETFLHAAGAALASRTPLPSLDGVTAARSAFSAALSSLRHQGITHSLPGEAVERIFGLAFGLEQLGDHLAGLAERATEFVHPTAAPAPPTALHETTVSH